MADVTLTYKGRNILELSASGNKTIKTAGKYCEGDIGLSYVRPDAPMPEPEPALPAVYQRVEYLEFEPAIGIFITLPTVTDDYILFEADCLSTKTCTAGNEDESDVFGYRLSSSTSKDFELGFRDGPAVHGFIRNVSISGEGLPLFHNKPYTLGERTKLYIILKEPRNTAFIGKYAYYNGSGVNRRAFQGKFYGLRGTKLTLGDEVAWFVPCYRKADNQVGVYDHIAHAFYYETYAVGSGYSITAGPDVN